METKFRFVAYNREMRRKKSKMQTTISNTCLPTDSVIHCESNSIRTTNRIKARLCLTLLNTYIRHIGQRVGYWSPIVCASAGDRTSNGWSTRLYSIALRPLSSISSATWLLFVLSIDAIIDVSKALENQPKLSQTEGREERDRCGGHWHHYSDGMRR